MYFACGTKVKDNEGKVVAVCGSSAFAVEVTEALNASPTQFNIDEDFEDDEFWAMPSPRTIRGRKAWQ